MNMTEIFMDEIEKIAAGIGGPNMAPLGQHNPGLYRGSPRTTKYDPTTRNRLAGHLTNVRKTQGPETGRIELAALRGHQQARDMDSPKAVGSVLKSRKVDPVSGPESMTTQAIKEHKRAGLST